MAIMAISGNKQELGNALGVGSLVYINVPGPSLSMAKVECTRGVVHYKGEVGDLIFGISNYRFLLLYCRYYCLT